MCCSTEGLFDRVVLLTLVLRERQLIVSEPAPDPTTLSDRQRKVLACIASSVNERGYPPSMREIGISVGLTSPSSVKYQLNALEKKGFLRRDPNRPRAMEVVGGPKVAPEAPERISSSAMVPVIGRIAAGGPILAEQQVEDIFTMPRQLIGAGSHFMLRVVGDSMVDAAICDGDYVVVRQQNAAENGEIVAAMLGDEATVKVLKKTPSGVWLMPRNSNYEPICGDEAVILGRVSAVMRSV